MINLMFCSGMSSKSDLRGAIEANVPVGVVAGLLTTASMLMVIPRYLDSGGHVFVDSGAFASFLTGVRPDWSDVLSRYSAIATMTNSPSRLHVVAPDQVGDQRGSLELLGLWATKIRDLISQGCDVIVPIQAGDIPGQRVIDLISEMLGTSSFTVGIPSNRAAMSIEECRTLRHHRFHILGQVHLDEVQINRIAALKEGNPANVHLSADANWLRSRMRAVCKATDKERDARQACAGDSTRFPRLIFDHPRAEAVRKTLLAENSWGRNVKLSSPLDRHHRA